MVIKPARFHLLRMQPTGLFPQFLRDMIGDEGGEDVVGAYRERLQFLWIGNGMGEATGRLVGWHG